MPSVGTLYSIANQLELVVDDLFRDAGSGPRAASAPKPPRMPPIQYSGRMTEKRSGSPKASAGSA